MQSQAGQWTLRFELFGRDPCLRRPLRSRTRGTRLVENKLEEMKAEIAAWDSLSRSTGFVLVTAEPCEFVPPGALQTHKYSSRLRRRFAAYQRRGAIGRREEGTEPLARTKNGYSRGRRWVRSISVEMCQPCGHAYSWRQDPCFPMR